MKKLLAFSGSNNSVSINHQLVLCATSLLKHHDVTVVELRNYPAPLFSIDVEKEGFPKPMLEFNALLKNFDGLVISLPEHNSSITPVFKNTVDWVSRIEMPVFKDKPLLLMSTSRGKRGGMTNLGHVNGLMPRWGGKVAATFSLPSFTDNFDVTTGMIRNEEEMTKLVAAVAEFEKMLVTV
jgi:NAD(P)H-dependent FMN reductase